MNFPVFHLDGLGNPILVALIAVIHVLINHPLAVGIAPLIVGLEWWGYRTGVKTWDELAYRVLFVIFIITTTFGAMTGVGIWFSTSLVNPDAIGSLIRVFFWGWFAEWIIFVAEVVLILAYFMTWRRWTQRTEPFAINLGPAGVLRVKPKLAHIWLGVALAVFSWGTMAVIVGILGFMMDSGQWVTDHGFFSGFFNPLYFPQLAFRTCCALMGAGLVVLALIPFFTRRDDPVRRRAIRVVSLWVGYWLIWTLGAGLLYWYMIPRSMVGNLAVALTTQDFTDWHEAVLATLLIAVGVIAAVAAWGAIRPRWLPRVALVVPMILAMGLLGSFERVREFIRKPWVIQNYLYSNGLRVEDYPLYQQEGLLAHATYTTTPIVTEDNKLEAGRNVFTLACTRCHTVDGTFSVRWRLTRLYGEEEPWNPEEIASFIVGMHNVRPFMPPFPGSDAERDALAVYLSSLQDPAAARREFVLHHGEVSR